MLHGTQGCEGKQECIVLTLNTHQATFIGKFCDIMAGIGSVTELIRRDNAVRMDKHEFCNSYLDRVQNGTLTGADIIINVFVLELLRKDPK